MMNRYSKWNRADTYRKRNKDIVSVFKGQEMCFFQYKANHVYCINAYVRYCHSALDKVDIEILCRILESHVIVLEQLYCYMYMQGMDVSLTELTHRLQILHSKNFIRKGLVISGRENTFLNHVYYENLEFYQIMPPGVVFLRNIGISINEANQYDHPAINISWYEYVKASIMYNQIVLQLLLKNEHVQNFNFHFLFKMGGGVKAVYAPLVVNTDKKLYVFEFIRGTKEGKRVIVEKYFKWRKNSKIRGRYVNLVFLCENEYHMEMMVSHMKNIADCKFLSIYFTFDKLWFGLEKEKIMKLNLEEGHLSKRRSLT